MTRKAIKMFPKEIATCNRERFLLDRKTLIRLTRSSAQKYQNFTATRAHSNKVIAFLLKSVSCEVINHIGVINKSFIKFGTVHWKSRRGTCERVSKLCRQNYNLKQCCGMSRITIKVCF